MAQKLPPTHDIRAVDFEDVQTFFDEIVKDPNLIHTEELKFVKTFLENFNASIPKLKVERKEEKGNVDASEDATASAHIFVSNDGVGDFSQEAGHLVIQARTHTSVYRDIIFAGGINNASDLMRITGEGAVGIGTTSPSGQLNVHSSTAGSLIKVSDSTTGNSATDGLDLLVSGTTGYLWNRESGNLLFGTSNTERMRLTS